MTIKRPAIIFHAVTMACPRTNPSTITKRTIAIDPLSTADMTVPQTNTSKTVLNMQLWLVFQRAVWRVQRAGLI